MKYKFDWLSYPDHMKLLQYLHGQARFVGGAVRNTILNIAPDDFDLATPYTPQEVMALLQPHQVKVIPTGLSHGTVTAILHDKPYEITTLRRDVCTDGRWAKVEYTSAWHHDADRRDFTMNALYVDKDGTLYDYHGGIDDIQKKYIRFIGQPEKRIQEDYLRILRFFRFWTYYAQQADEASLLASCALRENLALLSRERITKEFIKILQAPHPWPVLTTMQEKNILPFVLERPIHTFLHLQEIEQKLSVWDPWVRLLTLGVPPFTRLSLSRQQKHQLHLLSVPITFAQAIESVYDTSLDITQGRLILYTLGLMEKGFPEALSELESLCKHLAQQSFPLFPLTGQDLYNCHINGPQIKFTLLHVRRWWIHCDQKPSKEECLAYAQALNETS